MSADAVADEISQPITVAATRATEDDQHAEQQPGQPALSVRAVSTVERTFLSNAWGVETFEEVASPMGCSRSKERPNTPRSC